MTEPKKSFAERRAELAKQRGRVLDEVVTTPAKIEPPRVAVDDDLIPDVLGDRTEEDLQVDSIIAGIDPLSAYRRWIGKEVAENETDRDEVHVSCPFPNHRDSHPSAWLLTKDKGTKPKGTWFCGGCQEGGDLHDMAAIGLGHDLRTYKIGKNFHDLRKDMAESFGYRFKTVAGTEVVWKEEEASAVAESPLGETSPAGADAPGEAVDADGGIVDEAREAPAVRLLKAPPEEDDAVDEIDYPTLDWRAITPEGTFLFEYMKACTNDDSPEEYHFWHGLLALGHAVGRNAFLNDTRPVYGNLLVCLLGGTGFGKSRSQNWLYDVVEAALPYHDNGLDTTGTRLVPVPASGENLINQFQHIAHDPSMPKGGPEVRTPINGIVDYDEFAGLLTRASRSGSTLKQIVMGFSDARNKISSSSNTGGTFEAYRPFCSITASTQPKAVRPLLSRTDTSSGFLNRWIFVGGPRKKREVMGGVYSSISVDLDPCIELLKRVRAWGGKERDVRFTPDGLAEFERFMSKRVFPIQEKDETDLLTRLDLTMKRLILLFCINEKKTSADEEIVSRVEPLLEYLMRCYGILNAEIGITAMSEITTEILRHIRKIEETTGRGATARDLGQRMKRKNYSPDLIKKALETMAALDWIDIEKPKGSSVGRPTVRYRAVS